jgi:quinol monooxygenase YgiN
VLIVIGSATAAPGRREDLVVAARIMAAATRREQGCSSYTFAADVEDEDRILSVEVWVDRAALDEHMTHPHTTAFLATAPGLVVGEPVMSFHEVP